MQHTNTLNKQTVQSRRKQTMFAIHPSVYIDMLKASFPQFHAHTFTVAKNGDYRTGQSCSNTSAPA